MHRILIGLLALATLVGTTFAAPAKKQSKSSPTHRPVKYAKTRSAATRTTTHATLATASRTGKYSRSRRTVAAQPRRSFQNAPTPERYKEIQQAMAAKGYFKGEVNGEWGPDSVDALRRFQGDQGLEADGKLGSLSLIALGLGPKRMTAQARTEQQAAPTGQPPETKEQP